MLSFKTIAASLFATVLLASCDQMGNKTDNKPSDSKSENTDETVAEKVSEELSSFIESNPVETVAKKDSGALSYSYESNANLPNVRFYSFEKVLDNYQLVKDLDKKAQSTITSYQNEENKKRDELQKEAARIEENARNGVYTDEESYRKAVESFTKKQQDAESYLANLQNKAMVQADSQQKAVLDSVNNFITRFNKVNNFDAIIVLSTGSYCDPSLDITNEIVKGLNAAYKK